jgi:uncharacterized secreted protein with C-terminal beta-propeller domain
VTINVASFLKYACVITTTQNKAFSKTHVQLSEIMVADFKEKPTV